MSSSSNSPGRVIALVGAESTGKTELAAALARRLQSAGLDAVAVPEYLRLFCEAQGRTPRQDEQRGIADEQSRLIRYAAGRHAVVVADTTALMIAVYSDYVFGDTSLYADAERAHAEAALTLLTGLDLPWVADGLQRDGAHVREGVDERVRAALQRGGSPYSLVYGLGPARVEAAWAAVCPLLGLPAGAKGSGESGESGEATTHTSRKLYCTECLDPHYERLFSRLLGRDPS
ncbi:AAA family ATPase [Caldimonas brevitalea]|uniref:Nicotinamide-nucleotide adenylyltransferase n=1 Tax=Caldimonas brevitalea TaxID=413882 RepID=A0A0G3BRI4_9BURK|nr:ATP-binding protein [Caldimonas brevitalea]AKJ29976.1 nicotinamide-nucleotide adenylyltransferase [Caldimonas brevitalea]